jgi:hypothetical protein
MPFLLRTRDVEWPSCPRGRRDRGPDQRTNARGEITMAPLKLQGDDGSTT